MITLCASRCLPCILTSERETIRPLMVCGAVLAYSGEGGGGLFPNKRMLIPTLTQTGKTNTVADVCSLLNCSLHAIQLLPCCFVPFLNVPFTFVPGFLCFCTAVLYRCSTLTSLLHFCSLLFCSPCIYSLLLSHVIHFFFELCSLCTFSTFVCSLFVSSLLLCTSGLNYVQEFGLSSTCIQVHHLKYWLSYLLPYYFSKPYLLSAEM
jgi:hypothetical protein